MQAAPTQSLSNDASAVDNDQAECSSIQMDHPDRMAELNGRYDLVLEQIDALDLQILRLLKEISGEKPANFQAPELPR
jgi:hypothetical protein